MADPDPMLLALIRYHCREGYYHSALKVTEEALKNFVNNPVLSFHAAICYLMEGAEQKALRLLEPISGEAEGLAAGALQAMIFAHKRAPQAAAAVDKEAVVLLEGRAKTERARGGDKAAFFAALFYALVGHWDKAREFLDKTSGVTAQYMSLRGWTELKSGRDMKGALKIFEDAIGSGDKVIDAWLGKAHYHHLRQNSQAMVEALDNASGLSVNFLGTNVEKMKAQLLARSWDRMSEAAERCLVIEPDCLEAQAYLVLHTLCSEGKYAEAATQIGSLIQELERLEPKNHPLFLSLAQLFSRVSGGKVEIVEQTKMLVEKALGIRKSGAGLTELGRQLRMLSQWRQAIKAYKEAMDLESSSPDPMIGLGYCQLMEGNIGDAEAQLEFIRAAHTLTTVIPELELLEAMVGMKKRSGAAALLGRFRGLVSARLGSTQGKPFGPDYLRALDPAFLLDVVGQLFQLAPAPSQAKKSDDPILGEIQRLVNVVTEGVPGLSQAHFLGGKAKWLAGQQEAAIGLLRLALSKDDANVAAHLLLAQIYMEKKNLSEASKCLEVGLSLNFAVRDHPLYHLIKARISKKGGNVEASVKLLQALMELPSFKQKDGARRLWEQGLELTEGDRVSVYLELIDSLQALDRTAEAKELMERALREFAGSVEEERLLLCSADLAVARGDIARALSLLQAIAAF